MSKPTASNTGKASTSAGELNLVSEAPSESVTKKESISKAQVLGQPDGPFGTAIASRSTVLLRSVGTARFSKFETVELAAHGLYIQVAKASSQPFKVKSTLIEFELFLGDAGDPETRIIRGIGHIEAIKNAVDVPVQVPSGYVFKVLQIKGDDLKDLEDYIHERLLRTAL
ncbi:MAG: hypothetical protein RJB13_507 [Pseudomonadota bacterium]|jgi:hypothetical protein